MNLFQFYFKCDSFGLYTQNTLMPQRQNPDTPRATAKFFPMLHFDEFCNLAKI